MAVELNHWGHRRLEGQAVSFGYAGLWRKGVWPSIVHIMS